MQKITFKQDKYSQARSNYSEILVLKCRKCGGFIANYQKDGPGDLLRIYVDRINDNKKIVDEFTIDKKLTCPHCQRLLGLGYLYPKEQRPAYILFQNTIVKKPLSFIRHLKCLLLGVLK